MKGYKGYKTSMSPHCKRLLEGRRLRREENPPSLSLSLSFAFSCMFRMLNTSPPHPHPPVPPPRPPPPSSPPTSFTAESLMWGLLCERWLASAWALLRPDHWPTHPPFKEVLGSWVHNKVTQLWTAGGILFQRANVFTFPSQDSLSLFFAPSISLFFPLSLSCPPPLQPFFPCILSAWPTVSALISIASQSEENMKANGGWGPVTTLRVKLQVSN